MWSQILVHFALSLTGSEITFLVNQNFVQILQNARRQPICFEYICQKLIRSRERHIEQVKIAKLKIWNLVWPAQHPQKKTDLDRRKKVNIKVKKKLHFYTARYKNNIFRKGWKASELFKVEGFSKCGCGCGRGVNIKTNIAVLQL